VADNERQNNSRIDNLFPDERKFLDGPIGFKDLPYIVRPIVEYLHETRPDAIVAADRGARFMAFAVFRSWKKRFPDERFPTRDAKIHFARITSKSAKSEQVERAIHHALGAAGLSAHQKQEAVPKVILLDDWVDGGSTIKRFTAAVESFGLSAANTSLVTMCGKTADGFNHMVSDPSRDTTNSIWNAYDEYIGVTYHRQNPTVPMAWPNADARSARERVGQYIDDYYERFSAALTLGEIAACSCLKET